jgi:hypothetical protein
MRTIRLTDASAPLADYATGPAPEPLIVTARGRPVAVLVPFGDTSIPPAWISSDPEFLALMERYPTLPPSQRVATPEGKSQPIEIEIALPPGRSTTGRKRTGSTKRSPRRA